jgi:hypothetical protein
MCSSPEDARKKKSQILNAAIIINTFYRSHADTFSHLKQEIKILGDQQEVVQWFKTSINSTRLVKRIGQSANSENHFTNIKNECCSTLYL